MWHVKCEARPDRVARTPAGVSHHRLKTRDVMC